MSRPGGTSPAPARAGRRDAARDPRRGAGAVRARRLRRDDDGGDRRRGGRGDQDGLHRVRDEERRAARALAPAAARRRGRRADRRAARGTARCSTSRTRRAACALGARNSRAVKERAGAPARVIRTAALVDADAAALWARIESDFHANQRAIVETLHRDGALRRGLGVARATDILWTLNHPDVWHLLVVERGWTPAAWERWFAAAAREQLLAHRRDPSGERCEHTFVSVGAANILHADLDSFYASVEQRDDPALHGRPVIVGAGVVLAASYEAKAFGVRSRWAAGRRGSCAPTRSSSRRGSTPTSTRARPCSPSSRTRRRSSRGCRSTRRSSTSRGLERISGPPVEIAAGCGDGSSSRSGLPITVGVARTKFLAKVASSVAKPDGLLLVPPDRELAFLHPLPVERAVGGREGDVGEAPRRAGSGPWPRSRAVGGGRSSGCSAGVGPAHPRARERARPAPGDRSGRRRRSIGSQRAMGRGPWSWETLDATLVGIGDRLGRRLRDRAAGVPDGRPAPALRRLHARDALAHAARRDDAHRRRSSPPPAGCWPRRGRRSAARHHAARAVADEPRGRGRDPARAADRPPPRAGHGARRRARALRHGRDHARRPARPRPGVLGAPPPGLMAGGRSHRVGVEVVGLGIMRPRPLARSLPGRRPPGAPAARRGHGRLDSRGVEHGAPSPTETWDEFFSEFYLRAYREAERNARGRGAGARRRAAVGLPAGRRPARRPVRVRPPRAAARRDGPKVTGVDRAQVLLDEAKRRAGHGALAEVRARGLPRPADARRELRRRAEPVLVARLPRRRGGHARPGGDRPRAAPGRAAASSRSSTATCWCGASREHDWHLLGEGRLMLEQRTFDPVSGVAQTTQTLIESSGERESRTFSIRVYTATELLAMLAARGSPRPAATATSRAGPFATDTRLVVVAPRDEGAGPVRRRPSPPRAAAPPSGPRRPRPPMATRLGSVASASGSGSAWTIASARVERLSAV